MEISSKNDFVFEVKRCEPELVAPAKPTPHEFKQLSDIDNQESLRFHVPLIQLYPHNPSMDIGKDPVKVIKEAVAETLVFYYPFAGRLRELGSNYKKLFVECTGEGILFVEANANVTLQHFEDHALQPPIFPCMDELLFDDPIFDEILNSPLLLIQVTRLNCGGFIFAIRFNHMISDGSGIVQFLMAIAEMARGAIAPSILPIWQRSLLLAKDPQRLTYEQVDGTMSFDDMTHRSFFFGPTELSAIRKTLPTHLAHCTTFELLAACIWRLRSLAFRLGPHEELNFFCVMNLRTKLRFLPSGYYGNAVAFSKALTTAGELCGNPLSYGVELVMKAKANITEEFVKSLGDLMRIKCPPFVNSTRFFTISNLTRLGFDEVDYGWGKPTYGGIGLGGARMIAMSLCFFIPLKNKNGENGVLVPLCLPTPSMKRFVAGLDELLEMKYLAGEVQGQTTIKSTLS